MHKISFKDYIGRPGNTQTIRTTQPAASFTSETENCCMSADSFAPLPCQHRIKGCQCEFALRGQPSRHLTLDRHLSAVVNGGKVGTVRLLGFLPRLAKNGCYNQQRTRQHHEGVRQSGSVGQQAQLRNPLHIRVHVPIMQTLRELAASTAPGKRKQGSIPGARCPIKLGSLGL